MIDQNKIAQLGNTLVMLVTWAQHTSDEDAAEVLSDTQDSLVKAISEAWGPEVAYALAQGWVTDLTEYDSSDEGGVITMALGFPELITARDGELLVWDPLAESHVRLWVTEDLAQVVREGYLREIGGSYSLTDKGTRLREQLVALRLI